MQLALDEARAAVARGEVPVGCVIVRDGAVVSRAGNRTISDRDPTAHAEMLAIQQAAVALGSGGIAATGAVASSAAVSAAKRHVEGRVVAINRQGRTFTVRDTERGTIGTIP